MAVIIKCQGPMWPPGDLVTLPVKASMFSDFYVLSRIGGRYAKILFTEDLYWGATSF